MKKVWIFIASSMLIGTCPAQNIGIDIATPSEKLHVAGNIKGDTLKPAALTLTPNAGEGKVLTSDATGNGSWQNLNGAAAGNTGFGVWGDCNTNGNISEYNPVADGEPHDWFGNSVSISGNYAIVGAYRDEVTFLNQGSASVYEYDGRNWTGIQKFTVPDGAQNDYFGISVAIFGNHAFIGASGDDVGANANQGSAYVYFYNGSSWIFTQQLNDPSGAANDQFGNSVSISGNYAVVGASTDDVSAMTDRGSVFVYFFNGTSWILTQQLTDPAGAAADFFGGAVSISDNYIIVGAYSDDAGAITNQGSASIFWYNGSTWTFMQTLTQTSGAANDNFGNSVSISGNYAIVGSENDDIGTIVNQGSAYIYKYNGTTWEFMQQLSDPAGITQDSYGYSVVISGNHVIVGTRDDDIGTAASQGSASIYVRVGNIWKRLQFLTDPMGDAEDYFGNSVSMDSENKRFVIGAPAIPGIPGPGVPAPESGKAIFGKIN